MRAELLVWSGIALLLGSAAFLTITTWALVPFFGGLLVLLLGLKRMFGD